MSVQTQIDRISDAVSAAKAALTEKGVTVPDGTKVDGLAALIAAIEAGGGGGSAFATGTYTAVEKVQAASVEITHGLGVIPKTIMWFVTAPTGKVSAAMPLLALFCDEYGCSTCANSSSSTAADSMNYSVRTYKIERLEPTEETIKLSNSIFIGGGYIMAGFTVTWAVWG